MDNIWPGIKFIFVYENIQHDKVYFIYSPMPCQCPGRRRSGLRGGPCRGASAVLPPLAAAGAGLSPRAAGAGPRLPPRMLLHPVPDSA